MGTSLTGTKINQTYDALIKVSDNGALDGTLQTLTDGLGNNSSLSLSTAGASVTGTLAVSGNATFDTTTLVVDASNNRVGVGTSSPADSLEVAGDTASAHRIRINNANASGGETLIFTQGSTIKSWIEYNNSTSNLDIWQYTPNNIRFGTNNGEKMRIDSSGNVGIGESSLTGGNTILDLKRTGASKGNNIRFKNDYNSSLFFGISGDTLGDAIIYNQNNSNIIFYTGSSGTERMRITSGGNLYVNRTSGLNSQHAIQGDISDAGNAAITVYNQNLSDASPALNAVKNSGTTTSSARFIQFYSDGGSQPMGGIVGNGAENVQFLTLSDEREKENIVEISGSLDKIMQLQVSEFDWKKTGEHINAGFIAQNVETVFPEYVVENAANEGQEARKGITGGMSAGYVAHLTKAIQELKAEIELLKSQING